MNTLLYPIPARYFPGVKIRTQFHAKVNYKVTAGKVFIEDVCFSANCLQHIANTAGLMNEMKDVLQKVEDKSGNSVHPTIMSAIAPHINY